MTNPVERIRQLSSLIAELPADPTASRRLADACLVQGLSHSDRLGLVVITLIERADEIEPDELAAVLSREQQSRAMQSSGSLSPGGGLIIKGGRWHG